MSKPHTHSATRNPATLNPVTLNTLEAPLVLIDPCAGFSAMPDDPEICAGCGWLADDHASEHSSRQAA